MRYTTKHLLLSAFFIAGSYSFAGAHDFWISPGTIEAGKPAVIELGYSDNFPKTEAINKDRKFIFDDPTLVSKEGPLSLKAGSTNIEYISEKPLEKGSYIATATYKPTFWSTLSDGSSKMQNKSQLKDATSCEHWTRYAKTIINVGETDDFVTKPVGHALELVPLKNPAEAKVGQPFKIQVLFNGRPRVGVKVLGTFADFSENPASKAFYTVSDDKGQFDLIPLKGGYWKLMAEYQRPYSDKATCDTDDYDASLSFDIQ